jgi:hypothetical protein
MISCEASDRRAAGPAFPQYKPVGWACWLIEELVAARFAVSVEDLHASTRGRIDVAFARQVAIYLAHVVLGLNYADAGAVFRRDRTTASYACRLVEMRRDKPSIEKQLNTLEEICRDLLCRLTLPMVSQ